MKNFLINQAIIAFENYVRASNQLDDYEFEFLEFCFEEPTIVCRAYKRFKDIVSLCNLLTNSTESEIYFTARRNCRVKFIERPDMYNPANFF